MQAGITAGDWLIGGATCLLFLATAAVALVAYRQLSALRDESRRQRTIDLYARYEGESFVEPREAVSKAFKIVQQEGCGLMEASHHLTLGEQLSLTRFSNLLEEASQQYFAGLIDHRLAEQGLAYIAWDWWPRWRDYVYEQRAKQRTRKVFENWEDLHRQLDPIYAPISEQDAIQLATLLLDALGGQRRGLRRRLRKRVQKGNRFRVGPGWNALPWSDAVKTILSHYEELHDFCETHHTVETPGGQTEYVLSSWADTAPQAACRAIVVEIRAVRESRRGHESVRHVVSGLAWYADVDDAMASIGRPTQ